MKPALVAPVSTKAQKISREIIISEIFSCQEDKTEEDIDSKVHFYFKFEFLSRMVSYDAVSYGVTPQLQYKLCEQRSVSNVNFINMSQIPLSDDNFFFNFHVVVLPEDG